MESWIAFEESQFDRLFPFYILLDQNLRIKATGPSLKKLGGVPVGQGFTDCVRVTRPHTPTPDRTNLMTLAHQLVVLETRTPQPVQLRGQLEYLPALGEVLFIGSPWLSSVEALKPFNLQLNDFAHHDPLIDLLHVLKTQEITNADMKNLLVTLNHQKQALKKAHQEVHDIALFSMQNPDPIIRITLEGELLKQNPSAARLACFDLDGVGLRPEAFFQLIAARIDHQDPRWSIEAQVGHIVYSFLCVTMPGEGHINLYGRDITEQKKNEDRLAHLALVASANQNGVLFVDSDGSITWVNEGFCRLTGYRPDELIGCSPGRLCQGPLPEEASREPGRPLFSTDNEFRADRVFYRKDGSWFWGQVQGQPLRKRAGALTEYFVIIQDVTAGKETEEKLKVLSQIAEDNINAVIIADAQGRISWVNKSFTKLTGYQPNEVLGKKPGPLLQGKETDPATVDYLGRQLKKGEAFQTELINYHKSGRNYWARLQGQAIKDSQGVITGFFALKQDITHEKESERLFRKALEHLGDNVWEHDFRTGVTYFSKSAHQLLGFTRPGLTNNQQLWWDSVHPDDLHLLEAADAQYRACRADAHSLEYRLIDQQQQVRWVLDRGVVIERDGLGHPTKIVGTHVDVSRQKKLETELKQAREHAEASTRAKEAFLANMSHEIRTPMNAIMGMSNQLAKTPLSEPQRFYLQTIHTAADNLLVIINDILDLSKIEAGKLTLERIGFAPRAIVAHALQVLQYKAQEKGLRLTHSFCDPMLAAVLLGDPYRFTQVLLNLLSNAIKFTDKGEVDLRCHVLGDKEASQTIEVSIRDTGIGMEEPFVARLFEKFSQEYESTTRKYGGTGLGMSICQELVSLMDGQISVKSRKGEGTTVVVVIDFPKGQPGDLPTRAESTGLNPDFLEGKTILIADDNAMNRLVAATILQGYGATIEEAADGLQALARVEQASPDLILMDIQMPLLNGYEAVQQLRQQGCRVPIIALTANAIRGEDEKCKAAGMNDYIAKPFKEDDFLGVIAHWLRPEPLMPRAIGHQTEPSAGERSHLDWSGVELISPGNNDFVRQLLQLFKEESSVAVAGLRLAYEQGDTDQIRKLAHRLKPSIDLLSIRSLQGPLRELEAQDGDLKNAPRLGDLLDLVDSTLSLVNREISLYLSR